VYAVVASPKAGVVLGPWKGTEIYVNAGSGFHSNDGRGATIAVDPVTGEPAPRVTPLAKARAAEIGVRSVRLARLQTTFTAWTLGLESELIFVGDAGTTEAGRPSRRLGIEWTNYYSPRPWLTFDADVSISRARFTDDNPDGAHIPGAVETVVAAGATVISRRGVFGSVRWRYFGPRPLVEDNSVRSRATSLVNLGAGYAITKQLRLAVDVFNLLGSTDSDIEYLYTSRLPGEPLSGISDIHFHPTLTRTARISLIVGM
jgi:outer membrane receptor protein involved in Fe transport